MPQESFRRWQAESIAQKGRASALLLGLSGAGLGFSVSLLSDESAYIGWIQSLVFHIHSITQLISIAAGVFFSLNRVMDFDQTALIAREREKNPSSSRLASMREKVRSRGRMTRRLYFVQVVFFVIGAVAFLGFAALRFSHILYPVSIATR